MSKYQALSRFFQTQTASFFRMTFDDVEREAGFKLPASARLHQAWWANDRARHVQAKAWLDAGYESGQVDMKAGTLVFTRVHIEYAAPKHGGMSDPAREFIPAEMPETRQNRHPLLGSMKGTFWIDPNWDLTQPTMSPEELDEMEANLDRTADLIEAGMTRKAR
jgi:hypothetical protein